MSYAADLHLHSSYAIGTSPTLDLPEMARWARIKGIDLIAASDFTHPAWLERLEGALVPAEGDLYELASDVAPAGGGPKVVLGTEISCVYPQDGRGHRVHLLLFAPSFETVHKLCIAFSPYGALASDGRPLLKLSSRDALAIALDVDERCEVVPAHVWTPWYSVYGSRGGFDSLADCFGDMAGHIHAVETGLSSDPSMNWAIAELDGRSLVSFSDAHSAPRMGRELTVFDGELSYDGFRKALATGGIGHTVEFYPEEGKYHYDGHRKCGVCQHPGVTLERGNRCPGCGRKLTLGVLNRISEIAERTAPHTISSRAVAVEQRDDGLYVDPSGKRRPFRRLVPLDEAIAAALGKGPATKAVRATYDRLIATVGSELEVLEAAPYEDLAAAVDEPVARAIIDARLGNVTVQPGYDGVYGSVTLGRSP